MLMRSGCDEQPGLITTEHPSASQNEDFREDGRMGRDVHKRS